jgi:hypothetical protein
VIIEFLPPRDLLSIASSCKMLRDRLTMSMAVKGAMACGSQGQALLVNVSWCLRHRAIFMPSPLRLLRLAQGSLCEFCCDRPICTTYLGLNWCPRCQYAHATLSTSFLARNTPVSTSLLLDSHRVVLHKAEWISDPEISVFKFFAGFRVSGDLVGPTCTFKHMQIIRSCPAQCRNQFLANKINQVLDYDPTSTDDYRQFMEAYNAARSETPT